MFDFIKNNTIFTNKYKTNSEAIIISCFFNPQGSEYIIAGYVTDDAMLGTVFHNTLSYEFGNNCL